MPCHVLHNRVHCYMDRVQMHAAKSGRSPATKSLVIAAISPLRQAVVWFNCECAHMNVAWQILMYIERFPYETPAKLQSMISYEFDLVDVTEFQQCVSEAQSMRAAKTPMSDSQFLCLWTSNQQLSMVSPKLHLGCSDVCTSEPLHSKVSSDFFPYLHFSSMQRLQHFIRKLSREYTVTSAGGFVNVIVYFSDLKVPPGSPVT